MRTYDIIDIGVNFPYYLVARTDFRIPPFAGYDHVYEGIHRKYGKLDVDWESVPRVRDAWWDWLWRVGYNGPYESVEQDRIIGKAFYDNRRVLAERSFEEFVEASLSDLRWSGS